MKKRKLEYEANFFNNIALFEDLTKLQLKCIFAMMDQQEYTKADISRKLDTDRQNVSKAMNQLAQVNIIVPVRVVGKSTLYVINDKWTDINVKGQLSLL